MTRLANASRICDLDSDLSNGFKINNLYPRPKKHLFDRPPVLCRGIYNFGWVKRKTSESNLQYVNKKSKFQSPDVEMCKTNDSLLELPSDLAANLL